MNRFERKDELSNKTYSAAEGSMYGRFIKYTQLDKLCTIEFNRKPLEVNVFIDMTQFLYHLYRFNSVTDPIGILTTMINMPLHYRNYFNRLGIKSNIFIIYSSNASINNYRYVPMYNNKYKGLAESNREVHTIVTHNIELLKTLVPYFPGIYLKIGTVEPTVIAYDIIDKFTRKGLDLPSIFITASDYAFQLPAVLRNVVMMYKRSRKEEDKGYVDTSFSVNNSNALFAYILKTKNKNLSVEKYTNLNQSWVSPFMILTGLQCRDIKSLFSYGKALEILQYINASYQVITPESMYNAIVDTNKDKAFLFPKEELELRYCAIDIDFQLKLYREMPESLETSWLKDLEDPVALNDIINTYFQGKNLIDLGML